MKLKIKIATVVFLISISLLVVAMKFGPPRQDNSPESKIEHFRKAYKTKYTRDDYRFGWKTIHYTCDSGTKRLIKQREKHERLYGLECKGEYINELKAFNRPRKKMPFPESEFNDPSYGVSALEEEIVGELNSNKPMNETIVLSRILAGINFHFAAYYERQNENGSSETYKFIRESLRVKSTTMSTAEAEPNLFLGPYTEHIFVRIEHVPDASIVSVDYSDNETFIR